MSFYRMQRDDTLTAVAEKFNTPIEYLVEANTNVLNINRTYAGHIIYIPFMYSFDHNVISNTRYIVENTSHVSQIAKELGFNIDVFLETNSKIDVLGRLNAGDVIVKPDFNPSDKAIAFVSDRNGQPSLFCFFNDSRGYVDLNIDRVDWHSAPKLTWNVSKLAFIDTDCDLRIIDLEKSEDFVIDSKLPKNATLEWAPQGDKLIYSTNQGISVYDDIKSKAYTLKSANDPYWLGDGGSFICTIDNAVWRYDFYTGMSKKIVERNEIKYGLKATRDGSLISYFLNRGSDFTLCIKDIFSNQEIERKRLQNVWHNSGIWSNDSRYFAFIRYGQKIKNGNIAIVSVVDREGNQTAEIPIVAEPGYVKMSWCKDSNKIMFSSRGSCGTGSLRIFIVDFKEGSCQLTGKGNSFNPDCI